MFDLEGCPVLDRHGGAVASTVPLRDLRGGAVIAIGDAASTANLLGGEVHALKSAELLASLLLNQPSASVPWDRLRLSYRHALRAELGRRWALSGRLAKQTWFGLQSAQADKRMAGLIQGLSQRADAAVLSDLLFNYRFERYGWKLIPYLF